jgi:hypothetical protein
MVNPGHPSRACLTCKARRIKCDESYPACSKCVKARRVCLAYDIPRKSICQSEGKNQILGTALDNTPSFRGIASCYRDFSFLISLPTPWNSEQFIALTTEVTTLGFQSLNSPSQDRESRISLHRKYGLAIYHLRNTVLSWPDEPILVLPILLFSLYEVRQTLVCFKIGLHRLTEMIDACEHRTTRQNMAGPSQCPDHATP